MATKKSDGYSWILRSSDDDHLFSKNLSEHGISVYRELISGVGQRFYAVPFIETTSMHHLPDESQSSGSSTPLDLATGHVESDISDPYADQKYWQLNQKLQYETVERERLEGELMLANRQCEYLARALNKAKVNDSIIFRCLAVNNEVISLVEGLGKECAEAMEFNPLPDSYSPF